MGLLAVLRQREAPSSGLDAGGAFAEFGPLVGCWLELLAASLRADGAEVVAPLPARLTAAARLLVDAAFDLFPDDALLRDVRTGVMDAAVHLRSAAHFVQEGCAVRAAPHLVRAAVELRTAAPSDAAVALVADLARRSISARPFWGEAATLAAAVCEALHAAELLDAR